MNLGFIIIWESGEFIFPEIINDLHSNFKILYSRSISWKENKVINNLNQLYPHRQFKKKSPKIIEIGGGNKDVRLHTVIVKIENNNNFLFSKLKSLKFKYRNIYNKNFIHCSSDFDESLSNIRSLLKLNNEKLDLISNNNHYITFDYNLKKILFSEVINFLNLHEVFHLLNKKNIKWVVLRNFNSIEKAIEPGFKDDIDLLVSDFYKTINILNALPATKCNYRVQYKVKVMNKLIPFDFRSIDDNYYDTNWSKNILESRIPFDYYFIPNNENYYYSLLYHALIHKPYLSIKYKRILASIKKEKKPSLLLLNKFLKINNYKISRPSDKSVYFIFSFNHLKYLIKSGLKRFFYL